MSDPYLIDCSGFCRGVYDVLPPDSYLFAGQLNLWMYETGWTRTERGGWVCPDCSHQYDKDHEEEVLL